MPPSSETKSTVQFMERLERYGYITAGISFLLLGMVVFGYGWVQFLRTAVDGLPVAVLTFMNDLLLVVILLELFRTVISFLKTRAIWLEPFLHVGIIAAIRRILTVGAQMAFAGLAEETARLLLLDIGVNLGVVLVLFFGLFLYRSRGGDRVADGTA